MTETQRKQFIRLRAEQDQAEARMDALDSDFESARDAKRNADLAVRNFLRGM